MIHGQRKQKKQKTKLEIQEEQTKSEKINQKLKEFFSLRKKQIQQFQIPSLLEFTSLLMQLSSDIPTIFNYRRQILELILSKNQKNSQENLKVISDDYKLNTMIIQQDPKSYTLWTHRQWLVQKFYLIDDKILDKQRQLCKKLLQKDQKNFHVWNYRSWINNINMNLDQQLNFTKEKIKQNPFNFSPYHFRSKYLIKKYQNIPQCRLYNMPKDIFKEELETAQTAIFLNPQEEAPWNYYNWILQQLIPAINVGNNKISQTQSEIYFNIKVSNPKSIIITNNNNIVIKNKTQSILHDTWIIQINQNIIISNNNQNNNIKFENCGKYIIGSKRQPDIIQQIKTILQEQSKFVKEVIQSQQDKCRFGWLQLIAINKAILLCGCSRQYWQKLTLQTFDIFKKLQNQKKSQKYIQKLKEYWQRISANDDKLLTRQQIALKTYYQQ